MINSSMPVAAAEFIANLTARMGFEMGDDRELGLDDGIRLMVQVGAVAAMTAKPGDTPLEVGRTVGDVAPANIQPYELGVATGIAMMMALGPMKVAAPPKSTLIFGSTPFAPLQKV